MRVRPRVLLAMLAFAIVVLAASSASAVLYVSAVPNLDVSGGTFPGEAFTIDVTLTTDPGSTLDYLGGPAGEAIALGFRAANYDRDVIRFESATIPSSVFGLAVPGLPSVEVGGITNNASGLEEAPLAGVRAGWSVNLFQGIALSPPAQGSGPAHFSVTFRVIGGGTTIIDFGAFLDYSDVYFVESGADDSQQIARIAINSIPEPTAALLIGLGLAGLGATDRRP